MKKPNVYIAVPNYSGVIPWSVTLSLVRMMSHEAKVGRECALEIVPRTRAPRVRNGIGHTFLKLGMDYMLTIDDDHMFPPDALEALLSRNLDIVGALAFIRGRDTSSTLVPSMYLKGQDDPPRYAPIEEWKDGELVEVDAMGMAFTLIHRRVLEALRPPWWWLSEVEGLGEDFYFCWKARNAGFKLHVDTSIEVPHLTDPMVLHSSIYKQERENAKRNVPGKEGRVLL